MRGKWYASVVGGECECQGDGRGSIHKHFRCEHDLITIVIPCEHKGKKHDTHYCKNTQRVTLPLPVFDVLVLMRWYEMTQKDKDEARVNLLKGFPGTSTLGNVGSYDAYKAMTGEEYDHEGRKD